MARASEPAWLTAAGIRHPQVRQIPMFLSHRRGRAGLGAIVAVGLVLGGWLAWTAVMVKAYRDGGKAGADRQCEVVCRGADKTSTNP